MEDVAFGRKAAVAGAEGLKPVGWSDLRGWLKLVAAAGELKRIDARVDPDEELAAITFMAALDDGGNEIYVSPQIEQILGFTQKEWLEDPILWYTRLHPDDRERWHLEFSRTCATGERFSSDYRFVARDGRVV